MSRNPRRWWILGVLCLSLFAATLDNTILNVAIPSLIADLGLTTGQTQWAVESYSLVFAGLLLTAGSLADRFGRKKGLLLGLILFGGASLGAALTGSADALILWRALMGVGGAFLMPGTLSILVHIFDDEERSRAIGIWGGASALGVAAGPLLGGLLVTHFWWGSVFLVNVPVVLLAGIAALILVPESRNPNAQRPDIPGAALATFGMVALVWSVISAPDHGWFSGQVLAAAGIGFASLVGFAAWECVTPTPMLNLALLRNRLLVGASVVGTLLMFALAGTTFILTQYLQFQLGYGPLTAGLATLPVALAIAMAAPVSPAIAERIGEGVTVGLGLAGIAVGMAVLGIGAPIDSYWPVLAGGMLLGAGMGTAMSPASAALMRSIPGEHAGIGSALNDTVQELGAAFGVAVLGAVFALTYRGSLPESAPSVARESLAGALSTGGEQLHQLARDGFDLAMQRGMLIGAAVAAPAAVVGWLLLRSPKANAAPPVVPVADVAAPAGLVVPADVRAAAMRLKTRVSVAGMTGDQIVDAVRSAVEKRV